MFVLYASRTLRTTAIGLAFALMLAGLMMIWPSSPVLADGELITPNVAVITNTVELASTTSFIQVPVTLTVGSAEIGSLAFALSYDVSCLRIEDAAQDVAFALPGGGFTGSALNDSANGVLRISIWDATTPIGALGDGNIVTITFTLEPSCRTGAQDVVDVLFTFADETFANPSGQPVAGAAYGGVYHLDVNQFPTDISFTRDDDNAKENNSGMRSVGSLSAVDVDANDVHTFSFDSACSGSWDNQGFTISGNLLMTDLLFDYESKSSYTLCLKVTDGRGGYFSKTITLLVIDVNEAPTAILLSNNIVNVETTPVGGIIGAFSALDQDLSDSHTFALVAGAGDDDNSSFTIDGDDLKLGAALTYNPAKPVYKIRVRAQDAGGLTVVQQFNIHTIGSPQLALPGEPNVPYVIANSAPITLPILFTTKGANIVSASFAITYNTDCLTYLDAGAWQSGFNGNATEENGVIAISLNSASRSLSDGAIGHLSFGGKSSCPAASSWTSLNFTEPPVLTALGGISITAAAPQNGRLVVVHNATRGDCNADGALNAADFTATVIEIFDVESTNTGPQSLDPASWLWSPLGTYAGSAMGCDSNADRYLNVSDVICTARRYFGLACGAGVMAAASAPALVSAPAVVPVSADQPVNVPIALTTNGNSIAALALTVDFDPRQLTLDLTDVDEDDVPDAIVINAPPGMWRTAIADLAQGRIHILASGLALPFPTFTDGDIAVIQFKGSAQATSGLASITLSNVSLGGVEGENVQTEVLLLEPEGSTSNIYLPFVTH